MIKKFIKKTLIVKILFSINNQWSVESKNNPNYSLFIAADETEENNKQIETKEYQTKLDKKDKDTELMKELKINNDEIDNLTEKLYKILESIMFYNFKNFIEKWKFLNFMEKTKRIKKLLKKWNIEDNDENFNKIIKKIEELQSQYQKIEELKIKDTPIATIDFIAIMKEMNELKSGNKNLENKTNDLKNWFLETFNGKDKNPWGSKESIFFIKKRLNDFKIIHKTQNLKLDIEKLKNNINNFANKIDINPKINEQKRQKLQELSAKFNIEYIEEPAPIPAISNMKEIKESIPEKEIFSILDHISMKKYCLEEVIPQFITELLNIFKNTNPELEEKINGVEKKIKKIKFEYRNLYLYKLLDIIHNDSYSDEEYIHQWNIFLDCIINQPK